MVKASINRIIEVAKRECGIMISRPLYLFCIVVAPLFVTLFFTSLMDEGQPTELPIGIVDLDNTKTSRTIVRNLSAFEMTHIEGHYSSVSDARKAMQQGTIYAFFYIPEGTTEKAISGRQPKISYYCNNAYYLAGSLTLKDLKTMAALSSASVGKAALLARGFTEKQAKSFLQPIAVDVHAIGNPWINYGIYLNNTIIPGIFMLLITMITVFTIGQELKKKTVKSWLAMSGDNMYIAIIGKLLPYTLVSLSVIFLIDIYFYEVLHYPCNSGICSMLLAGVLLVLSSQGLGVFMFGMVPTLRLALSLSSLWGVLAFSTSGFTFPVMTMDKPLQAIAGLFPLRHYYTIYEVQALNGNSIIYCWGSYLCLLIFAILPLFVMKKLHNGLLNFDYIP